MLIATLFTIAKTLKQTKCPSTDEWKEDTHTYTHTHTHTRARARAEILVNHKKNEILPFAKTWMHVEKTMVSEISQTENDSV